MSFVIAWAVCMAATHDTVRAQVPWPEPTDLGEYLVARDFAARGVVVSSIPRERRMVSEPRLPVPCLDLTVRVSSVIAGFAADSVIAISLAGPPDFRGVKLKPGTRVVVWGYREARDAWRLWGGACVINSSHIVLPLDSEGRITLGDHPSTDPISTDSLMAKLGAQASAAPQSVYFGVDAVGLARVAAVDRVGDAIELKCDSLRWVMGSAARIPRRIRWTPPNYCGVDFVTGDTLLVPVPEDLASPTLEMRACPTAMRVKSGFATGIGVPLDSLGRALDLSRGTMIVRPILARR